MSRGASWVSIAASSGHRHATLLVLEAFGFGDVLKRERITSHNFNTIDGFAIPNTDGYTNLSTLIFPGMFQKVD